MGDANFNRMLPCASEKCAEFIHGSIPAIEKFAGNVIRSSTLVFESIEQNNHQHPFVYAQICLRFHETKVEISGQRNASLSCFLLQICERRHVLRLPVNRAVRSSPLSAYAELLANTSDRNLAQPAGVWIRIHPAAGQLVGVHPLDVRID